jgi:hypothetical protein
MIQNVEILSWKNFQRFVGDLVALILQLVELWMTFVLKHALKHCFLCISGTTVKGFLGSFVIFCRLRLISVQNNER